MCIRDRSEEGHADVVSMLLAKQGVDVNQAKNNGVTPLYMASLQGHSEVVSMLLAGVILHGICYDFFFVTGQIYVDKAAPKEIRGSAQGLLVLVTLGAGMFIGAIVAGRIKGTYTSDTADWQAIWMWPAGMAAVVFVLFGLLFRDPPEEATQVEPTGLWKAEAEEETETAPTGDDPGGGEQASTEEDATAADTGEEEANDDEDDPVMPIAGE